MIVDVTSKESLNKLFNLVFVDLQTFIFAPCCSDSQVLNVRSTFDQPQAAVMQGEARGQTGFKPLTKKDKVMLVLCC